VSIGKTPGKNRAFGHSAHAAVFVRSRIALALSGFSAHRQPMALPDKPVTLSAEQVGELNRHLSKMRHDINNHLTVMMSAAELARRRPDTAEQRMSVLLEQVPKVIDALKAFSGEFEQTFGIPKR
jgi:hypothetical protein